MLIRGFVLTSRNGDILNFSFRNGFYFYDVAAGTTTYKLMTVIISGSDGEMKLHEALSFKPSGSQKG